MTTPSYSTRIGIAESRLEAGDVLRINYNAILTWLASSPDPFPSTLRGGRIKYYGAIPTSITGSWPSYGGTDQHFWVEIIDYVLGFRQTRPAVHDLPAASAADGNSGYGAISPGER